MGAATAVSFASARATFLAISLAAAWGPLATAQDGRARDDSTSQRQASAPQGSQAGPSKPVGLPALPPRRAIAGIQTLATTSTVTFDAAPEKTHELVATFAFPGRARLQLTLQDNATMQRKLRYVYGELAFALEPGSKASVELQAADRDEALAEVELRRAAFLWPDGFEWKAKDALREASAGKLGTLRARLEDAQRSPGAPAAPAAIELVDEHGAARIALRAIRWLEKDGRTWPASFEIWRGDKRVATEMVDARDTTRSYLDSFFLPADRRDASTEHDAMIGVVRSQELPSFCARRVVLEAGSTWTTARAQIEKLRVEWSATLARSSLALEPNWTVELDAEARPVALLVRTTAVPATPPEGFETTAVRQARVVFVRGLEEATAERLAALRRAAPPQAQAQAAYVRFRPQDGQVLLVLPLAP